LSWGEHFTEGQMTKAIVFIMILWSTQSTSKSGWIELGWQPAGLCSCGLAYCIRKQHLQEVLEYSPRSTKRAFKIICECMKSLRIILTTGLQNALIYNISTYIW